MSRDRSIDRDRREGCDTDRDKQTRKDEEYLEDDDKRVRDEEKQMEDRFENPFSDEKIEIPNAEHENMEALENYR